jgi:peptide/nickel transport system ATP-binding protein
VVRALCERVVIMRGGEIIEEGRTAEVFASPRSPFTQTLIDSIPLPEVRQNWLERRSVS